MLCRIVGAPVQDGAGRMGCEMGPSALRTAGLAATLKALGHEVQDWGAVQSAELPILKHDNAALKALPEIVAWTAAIAETAYEASAGAMPIFLGGDHSISAGTLSGVARRARSLVDRSSCSGSMRIPIFTRWTRLPAAICTECRSPMPAASRDLRAFSGARCDGGPNPHLRDRAAQCRSGGTFRLEPGRRHCA